MQLPYLVSKTPDTIKFIKRYPFFGQPPHLRYVLGAVGTGRNPI